LAKGVDICAANPYHAIHINEKGVWAMAEKCSAGMANRIPPEADGIQVNFCKNPGCANYGVAARSTIRRGGAGGKVQDGYELNSASAITPLLSCHGCGEQPPIKSNAAILEERTRFLAALTPCKAPSCRDETCAHHGVPVSAGTAFYQSFGLTHSGSRRYRCKACKKTFAVGKSTTGHKAPHKNRTIFSLLMNKSPLRRICEVADVDPKTLYGKIDFLYRQSLDFIADRERRLVDGMPIRRLYLGCDRQDYVVNWNHQKDRRNVVLHAIGTADNETRYVFGMHLNFDGALDAEVVEENARCVGDYDVKPPFRRHARCWLKGDYAVALKQSGARDMARAALNKQIAATYAEAERRADVEVSETQDTDRRLPTKGVQIHAEYTLYGHFFYLKMLFGGVEKLRFFLDQDSGMRAACLAAFQPEMQARKADAFYVRIAKGLTIDEKRAAIAASRNMFDTARGEHPDLSDAELKLLLIKERIAHMATLGTWKDRWLSHPFPNMSEPEKAVCYLTDLKAYDDDHLAWLYNKASLHAIDCFFMQVRRRLSLLERPISTASRAGRTWYGYSAYNPETIVKILGIFRTFYNYCLAGQDGKTPAMRLGLATGTVALDDIIYFV
jgi:transposase-like protein